MSKADTDKCLKEYSKATPEIETAPAARRNTSKSLLVPEPALNSSSSPFILHGRFLNLSRAVSRTDAQKLTEEGIQKRRDKRNIYLIKEGVIFPDSPAAQTLPARDVSKRMESYNARKRILDSNPNLYISKVRLSVRNLSPQITPQILKQVSRESVKLFWKQVTAGERSDLGPEDYEEEKEAGNAPPGLKRNVAIKQAKILYENDKVDSATGKKKSKGYGFVEFDSHADALACLRALNNNIEAFGEKGGKRSPIVEFSVENALIVKKREDRMVRLKTEKPQYNQKDKKPCKRKDRDSEPSSDAKKQKTAKYDKTKGDDKKHDKTKVDDKKHDKSPQKKDKFNKNIKKGEAKPATEAVVKQVTKEATKVPKRKNEEKVIAVKPPKKQKKLSEEDKEEKNFDVMVNKYKNEMFGDKSKKQAKAGFNKWFA